MIEYDKRIKDPTKILTPFSSGMEDYYGKECYCTDDLYDFRDLKVCTVDTLVDRPIINKEYQFATENGRFKYCLPSEFVEKSIKKQLRPFKTAKELPFTVGDILFLKDKESPTINKCICSNITCIDDRISLITLGTTVYSVYELFEKYRWKFTETGEWKQFGVAA